MDPQDNSCYQGETAETLAWRVAELEQENARLRAQSRRYQDILQSAAAYIFTFGPDNELTYLNRSRPDAEPGEELVGLHVNDLIFPEDVEVVEKTVERVRQENREQVCRVRSNLSGRIMHSRFAPLRGSSPKNEVADRPEIVGVSFDYTREHDERSELERKRDEAEAALRESDERFRIVVEATPVPVVISDLVTSQILYGNRALAETFATPFETLQGQRATSYYADPENRAALVKLLDSGQEIRGTTIEMRNAEGKPVWATVYPDRITFQGRPALLVCLMDVSERKRREDEILRDQLALRRLLDMNERDRQLIAYEIHDGVVQDMTGALMFLQAAASLMPQLVEGRDEVLRGSNLLAHAISEMRRLLNGLRPLSLEQGGVVAAIDDLVNKLDEEGFEVDFRHQVRFQRIAPSLEMAIYRTVQEAVNNVRRHANTDRATVEISQHHATIKISVRDHGCGFNPTEVDSRRYGLQGIRERARLLGGTAEIHSKPAAGTTVDVLLPLGDYLENPPQAAFF